MSKMRPLVFQAFGLALAILLTAGMTTSANATPLRSTNPLPPGPSGAVDQLDRYWLGAYDVKAPAHLFAQALSHELLAKAQPDECFDGAGNPYPAGPPCATGKAKVNQAYVWGLAKSGNDLWFGTAANVHCLVLGGFLGITSTLQTDSFVCEFASSQLVPPLPAIIGDWRPPQIYVYNTASRTLTPKTPLDPLIRDTLGLRSAGTFGKVAILAGPSLRSGINLFAFNTETGQYLGSNHLTQYNDIRKWLLVNGVLYTGVQKTAGGGAILRWLGDADNLTNLFSFEEVGNLDTEGAELALHQGRLYVTTWPSIASAASVTVAGLYMGPLIPAGGLTAADAGSWTKVWQASDYEPDPVTAATYGGGALISYGDYLYWGTMHVPFVAALANIKTYGQPSSVNETLATLLGTYRAVNIFRGRNFDQPGSAQIELLYGQSNLPKYQPGVGWTVVPNNMGAARTPLYGPSGFGNFYNNYTWSMAVYDRQLYVGTMDWSYLFNDTLPIIASMIAGQPVTVALPFPLGTYGADLWRFPATNQAAVPENVSGLGNPTSYGIRNLLAADALYIGMANPMNLLTDPSGGKPLGGWELIKAVPTLPVKTYLPLICAQIVSPDS